MEWHDAIEDSFPAPRDDEPTNLRRDIADELQDHLICAMDRESRKTTDDETAKAAALQQFGSPTQIARQLWWDAMKEKIMSQRLTLAAIGIAMAACLGVFVLSWMMFEDSRKVNLAIVSKLESLKSQQPADPPQSLEWTNVTFRCVQENEEGPPAEGFRIQLSGNPINESQSMTLKETVGDDGVAMFGPIRPGKYVYQIFSPWNQSTSEELVLLPGAKTEQLILCPAKQEETSAVKIKLIFSTEIREMLQDIDFQDVWVECVFNHTRQSRLIGKQHWYDLTQRNLLIMPDGNLIDRTDVATSYGFFGGGLGGPQLPGSFPANHSIYLDLKQHLPQLSVNLPSDSHTLSQIVLFKTKPAPENAKQQTLQAIMGYKLTPDEQQTFEAKFGQQNDWTIEVPEIKPLQKLQY